MSYGSLLKIHLGFSVLNPLTDFYSIDFLTFRQSTRIRLHSQLPRYCSVFSRCRVPSNFLTTSTVDCFGCSHLTNGNFYFMLFCNTSNSKTCTSALLRILLEPVYRLDCYSQVFMKANTVICSQDSWDKKGNAAVVISQFALQSSAEFFLGSCGISFQCFFDSCYLKSIHTSSSVQLTFHSFTDLYWKETSNTRAIILSCLSQSLFITVALNCISFIMKHSLLFWWLVTECIFNTGQKRNLVTLTLQSAQRSVAFVFKTFQ